MRLLNTKTFQLQEFYTDVPPYAILSHTWGKREVTFQNMQNTDAVKTREDLQAGWGKVKKACEHAQKYSFEWIWIDSCCINKESSAELSEALNSMYQYYEDAEVCYVYLFDVSRKEDPRDPSSAFRVSRWFKRGWTLQELLAPSHVVFLDKDWADLGTRQSLKDAISAITLIPIEVFEGKDITEFSIAQRMSWAAFRETTRSEDQAYSLMGIFGVNMPPIYGEGGPKAFVRLQQEIIKISDDRSIFAWIAPAGQTELRGLLARSPYEFRASGDVSVSAIVPVKNSLYSFGNNGLHIHLPLVATSVSRSGSYFLAPLHCLSKQDNKYLSLCLTQIEGERYVRCRASELILTSASPEGLPLHSVVVKEVLAPRNPKHKQQISPTLNFRIIPHPSTENRFISFQSVCDSSSPDTFHEIRQTQCLKIAPPTSPKLVLLKYCFLDDSSNILETFYLAVGARMTTPFCALLKDSQTNDTEQFFLTLEAMIEKVDTGDRMHLPLINGGLASVALQRSNPGTMIVELKYLPKDLPMLPLYAPIPSPKLGFLVPMSIYNGSYTLSLRTVSPPDFSGKTYDGQTYVSMPKVDDGKSVVFRVLTYAWRYATGEAELPVHVVVGFDGSLPWIDIVSELKTGEEAWKSYQVSAQQLRNLVILNLGGQNRRTMMTAKERTNLQLGSHVLSFDSRSRAQSIDLLPSFSEMPARQPSHFGTVVTSVSRWSMRRHQNIGIYVTTETESLHHLSSRMRSRGIDVTQISVLSLLREPSHLENCEICGAPDTGNIPDRSASSETIGQLTNNGDTKS
ncbi:HET-domain-containing protein [Dendrothele bispora CBS 962.96]|uniref:HET-domain-containing protein n=1 Tax=Dendrothele bispora (strain CBS 962.96) TaxID=1314807 RepID=A0A4S8M4K6_DENBC|nr:HET-domain-containing protein [Dendrothele bispora CBS 962.96]